VYNCRARQVASRPADGAPVAVSRNLRSADDATHPIFVVDDDASVRDSLSVLLSTLGFEVFAYSSGDQLLADDRHHRAGCLIVDQHMPGADGIEVLSALRSEGIDAPAILITGRLDPGIVSRAASIGMTVILEKPFPTTRLIELVGSSLEKKE
jgi:two-component system, LuxR family, response regulator FixJ